MCIWPVYVCLLACVCVIVNVYICAHARKGSSHYGGNSSNDDGNGDGGGYAPVRHTFNGQKSADVSFCINGTRKSHLPLTARDRILY